MIRGLSRAESRELDRTAIEEVGIPGIVLMEHASVGAALLAVRALAERRTAGVSGARVVVICGPGNNGGDGYAMARHLHNAGADVEVWDLVGGQPPSPESDAGKNREILSRMGVEPRDASDDLPSAPGDAKPDLLIDAIFGTGLTRPPEGRYARAVEWLNRAESPVLAVDIPSGLDADRGAPLGEAVRATWTVTFGAVKRGFSAAEARRYTGALFCVPIGIPRQLLPTGAPAFPPAPVPVELAPDERG